MKTFNKGPDDQLDYTIVWSALLGSDQIDSVLWTIPDGVELVQQADSQTVAVAWIKGGTLGASYKVSCQITTASTPARIATRSFRLRIAAR